MISPAASSTSTRYARWVILGLGLAWLVTVQSDLGDLAGDSAKYVALAQALVTGQGYRSIYLAGAPLHMEVPPLFPLSLAPVVALAGLHAWWLHVWMVLLATLTLALVWRNLRRCTDEPTALMVLFFTGTSLLWWDGVARIMSDVPFIGLAALTCDQLDRYRRTATVATRAWLGTLACLLAAVFLRTAGIALGITAALYLLDGSVRDRRPVGWRWRTLGLLAAWLGGCGLWYGYAASTGEPSYLVQWRQVDPMQSLAAMLGPASLLHRCATNLLYYAAEIARLWCPWHERVSSWPVLTVWPLAVVALAGWHRQWQRQRATAEWFVPVYVGMIVLWSYRDSRFLLPILPWLWLYVLTGLRALLRADGTSWGRRVYAGYVVVLAVAVSLLMGMRMREHLTGQRLGPNQRQYVEANRWLGSHTSAESVVMSSKPSVTWWYSRRQAVAYPVVGVGEPPERVRAAVEAQGADYLLLDGFSSPVRDVIAPALRARPDGLQLEAAFGRSIVLRRVSNPSSDVRRPRSLLTN